jgi:GT2 family glycosyltransferase
MAKTDIELEYEKYYGAAYREEPECLATIFIMNYNGMQFVERCINAAKAQTMSCKIVFMDNGSTDASAQYAGSWDCISQVVCNPKNMHINYMQQQALDMCRTKYAAFCHIDCVPEPEWIEKLVAAAEAENAGAVEPEIVHPNGQVLHGMLTRWFAAKLAGCERYPVVVCTAATLYRNSGLKLFKASYLHYHDEDHACEVLKRHGWGLVHVKDCIVMHEGSHSGLVGLKWKLLGRFNQLRMIIEFGSPAANPLAEKVVQ